MEKLKFIFTTIEEVMSKEKELNAIYGADNMTHTLDMNVYFYVTFNIFK